MIRVVIVDDQALLRSGFRMILEVEEDLTVVGEASNGAEALELIKRVNVDVVLMDIRMPVMDGVEATKLIAADPDGPRVIILTTFSLDEYVFAALAAGASGFLLKDTPPESLAEAIRVVHSGDALLSPAVTKTVISQHVTRQATKTHPGIAELTEREHEVLLAMATGHSNAEIGTLLFVSETTVKTHVGRVLSKLGVRDRTQAVVVAYQAGVVE